MRIYRHTIVLLIIVLIAACGPVERPADADATMLPSEGDEEPAQPTATSPALQEVMPEATPEGYPAPSEPTAVPDSYPVPATPVPTVDSYPAGGFIWIIRPVGVQCSDPEDNEYADLSEAVAALAAAGVPAQAPGMVDLNVCAACTCPTSTHYRVQIDPVHLNTASDLGWVAEQQ